MTRRERFTLPLMVYQIRGDTFGRHSPCLRSSRSYECEFGFHYSALISHGLVDDSGCVESISRGRRRELEAQSDRNCDGRNVKHDRPSQWFCYKVRGGYGARFLPDVVSSAPALFRCSGRCFRSFRRCVLFNPHCSHWASTTATEASLEL